jgi:hypothetical protein
MKFVKKAMTGSAFKDLGQRVNGKHEEKRRERISLPKPTPMHNGVSGDAIE